MTLTNKQRVFIEEYLKDFNATRAAKAAGYSEKTARSSGAENLTKPDIQAEIKAALDERAMSANEVLQGLTYIARGDIADLLAVTPTNYELALMIDDEAGNKIVNPATKLIKKIKQKTTTILSKKEDGEDREIVETEVELYSALEAYNMLGKHHALFVDRSDVHNTGEIKVIWDYPIPPMKSE